METNGEEKYRAPALGKGLDILELISGQAEGMTQAEIAKTLGRTASEIFRMLAVLRQRGYVELDGDRYFLTARMLEVAYANPPMRRLLSLSRVPMQRLAREINQSLHLCVLHAGGLLVVAQVDSADTNVNTVRLGARIPIANSASGRVLAAFMPEDHLQDLLGQVTDTPHDSLKRFLADLPAVRAAGYCEGSSLTLRGITNLSAPILDFSGQALAAMTIPFVQRLTDEAHASVHGARIALVETCKALSSRMGAANLRP